LPSSGIASLDAVLGGQGYPEKSTILLVGAPGVGKEALGYWFAHVGLLEGDSCIYITRMSVRQVVKDASAVGVNYSGRFPLWIASEGGQIKFDANDLASLSFNLKEAIKVQRSRRIRIVADVLSPLLMLHPPETIYRFMTQLLDEVRHSDAVLLATLEDGMHQPQVTTAMEQLFDGVVELRLYEEGLRFVPILRVRKMLGLPPKPGYFNFAFTQNGMELSEFAK
jgi:KaiC/GvpD/RAD55 family RecA-like ATPase